MLQVTRVASDETLFFYVLIIYGVCKKKIAENCNRMSKKKILSFFYIMFLKFHDIKLWIPKNVTVIFASKWTPN